MGVNAEIKLKVFLKKKKKPRYLKKKAILIVIGTIPKNKNTKTMERNKKPTFPQTIILVEALFKFTRQARRVVLPSLPLKKKIDNMMMEEIQRYKKTKT